MKKILVTGGCGFLGSHLVDMLVERGEKNIHIVDNLSSNAVDPYVFRDKPVDYWVNSIQRFLISNTETYNEIYHLASIVGPAGVLPHAGNIAQSIIDDAAAVAEKAVADRARLVFVSTSEVYGGGNEGLCQEDMPKVITPEVSARLEYAVGKLAAEVALINQVESVGLDAVIVRPFNIAGPRQQTTGGFVLPRFIKQAMTGLPLTVFGDGKQLRALTHVRDVAEGLIKAMSRGELGGVYNIGAAGNKTTIEDLAKLVIEITGSSSRILYSDPQKFFGDTYAEANDKFPDSSKANADLEWHPTYSLREIVEDTYKWSKR